MNSVISVQDLCLWYGEHQALKNVSIKIPEKSITALIGPSGCGKSTFLKTLNRMNDLIPGVKITGSVEYKGENIFDPAMDVNELRRQVGMVFQKPNPFPMSIYDNIAYGPRTHGIRSKAKLDDIVERSLRGAAIWDEVKDRLKKNALGLSGGQQQRLCIARALAVKPKVLLMDEPLGAVDFQMRQLLQRQLEDILGQKKTTSLMVTHDVDESVYLSDRVIVMSRDHGKILEDLKIDLPRPRDRTNPQYHAYVDQLTEILKSALSGGVYTQEDKDIMEFIQGVESAKKPAGDTAGATA